LFCQPQSSDPSDRTVRKHLQGLFDTTVEKNSLLLHFKQKLADVLHCSASFFDTGLQELGFCCVLMHEIDTGRKTMTAHHNRVTGDNPTDM